MTTELTKSNEADNGEQCARAEAALKIKSAFSECIQTFSDLIRIDASMKNFASDIDPTLKIKLFPWSGFTVRGSDNLSQSGSIAIGLFLVLGIIAALYTANVELTPTSTMLMALGIFSAWYIPYGGKGVESRLASRLLEDKEALFELAPLLCDCDTERGIFGEQLFVDKMKAVTISIKKGEEPCNSDVIKLAEALFHEVKKYEENADLLEFDKEFCKG